MACGIRH